MDPTQQLNTTGSTAGTTATPPATATEQETNQDRIGLLKSRLQLAKKFCKKPHEALKRYYAEYEIEDVEDIKEIRDKVRVGTIFRQSESDLPAIFDDQPDLFMKGKGKYRVFDPYISNVYGWLWDIQSLEEKIEDAGLYFLVGGMAFMTSPWMTKTQDVQQPVTDQMGQPVADPATGQPQMQTFTVPVIDRPDAETENVFKLFFSPETKFNTFMDAKHCPYYFKEYIMSPEEIKSRFNKDVDTGEVLATSDVDLNLEIQDMQRDDRQKQDIKRICVYEYYGILPQNMVSDIEQKKGWNYDQDYHVWMTTNEELQIEECQYDVKPLLVLGNYGLMHKFWKFGDAKHLLPLVQEYQQYRTQMLKYTRRMANPKPMIPMDGEVDEKAFKDSNMGEPVKYQPGASGLKPEYMQPPQLGQEVNIAAQNSKQDIEQQKGSFNLAQGSDSSTVKTPRGIQTFSEAADRNVRRKRKKIARFIRALIIFQFKQVSQNMQPDNPDVVDIVYGGDESPKAQIPEVLAILGNTNVLAKVDIEVESLSVNKVQMRQDSLDFFDVASQHPDIFNVIEAARDLVQNGFGKKDADRYLIPMDQIKAQAVQEFIMQVGQANPQLGGQLAQMIAQPNAMAMQSQQNEPDFKGGNGQPMPPANAQPMPPAAG